MIIARGCASRWACPSPAVLPRTGLHWITRCGLLPAVGFQLDKSNWAWGFAEAESNILLAQTGCGWGRCLGDCPGSGHTAIAVSYTHLDVYKRQLYLSQGRALSFSRLHMSLLVWNKMTTFVDTICCPCCPGRSYRAVVPVGAAVSYTHLDVYKRQVLA